METQGKIFNPKTNRYVLANGATAKKIMRELKKKCPHANKENVERVEKENVEPIKPIIFADDDCHQPIDALQELYEYAEKELTIMYESGKDLVSTALKRFSGPELEKFSKKILRKAIELAGLDMEHVQINQDYFKDEKGVYDNQRLDQHVKYHDKYIMLCEDRAWIDKPFYTLKRGVVHTFMNLPHVKQHLHENVMFVFQSFSTDVSRKTMITSDYTMGYGDRIMMFQLNDYKRAKYNNWFVGGFDPVRVRSYLAFLLNHFRQFA